MGYIHVCASFLYSHSAFRMASNTRHQTPRVPFRQHVIPFAVLPLCISQIGGMKIYGAEGTKWPKIRIFETMGKETALMKDGIGKKKEKKASEERSARKGNFINTDCVCIKIYAVIAWYSSPPLPHACGTEVLVGFGSHILRFDGGKLVNRVSQRKQNLLWLYFSLNVDVVLTTPESHIMNTQPRSTLFLILCHCPLSVHGMRAPYTIVCFSILCSDSDNQVNLLVRCLYIYYVKWCATIYLFNGWTSYAKQASVHMFM